MPWSWWKPHPRSTALTRDGQFRPLPFLANPHVQTILGAYLQGPPLRHETRERQVPLPDGDRLVLHENRPAHWRDGTPVAVLVHGLGGCHRSGYMQRVARALLGRGLAVVRLDLRGCGRGLTLAHRSYNAGCSDDVRAALDVVRRWAPSSPLLLAGFSLGGNIVLKLAGELAGQPVPGLTRVAAVAPPVDLERCSALLSQPRNRVYELHFLRELLDLVRRRQRLRRDLPPVRFPRRLTLRIFDDLYTAPLGGYDGVADYYRRASSRPLVPRIAVPTLVLTARDDPFIAVEAFEGLGAPEDVRVQILPTGGHLGFLGWDGAGGIRWAERRVVDWLTHDDTAPAP